MKLQIIGVTLSPVNSILLKVSIKIFMFVFPQNFIPGKIGMAFLTFYFFLKLFLAIPFTNLLEIFLGQSFSLIIMFTKRVSR